MGMNLRAGIQEGKYMRPMGNTIDQLANLSRGPNVCKKESTVPIVAPLGQNAGEVGFGGQKDRKDVFVVRCLYDDDDDDAARAAHVQRRACTNPSARRLGSHVQCTQPQPPLVY